MHLSRVEDEFMHRRNKVTTETRQEFLTLALLVTEDEGDNNVPMNKEKSPSRNTADQSPARPALQPPPTMIQSTVMSAIRV